MHVIIPGSKDNLVSRELCSTHLNVLSPTRMRTGHASRICGFPYQDKLSFAATSANPTQPIGLGDVATTGVTMP